MGKLSLMLAATGSGCCVDAALLPWLTAWAAAALGAWLHARLPAGRMDMDEAVLIAKRHSAEVKELRDILNTLTAPDGRPYNFRLATWDEEGIVIRQSA